MARQTVFFGVALLLVGMLGVLLALLAIFIHVSGEEPVSSADRRPESLWFPRNSGWYRLGASKVPTSNLGKPKLLASSCSRPR